MSRYRLLPAPAQKAVLRDHCGHARYVWNLAVEQRAHWRPGRTGAPGYLEQCRQLTAARAGHDWLAAGSQMVQQQVKRKLAPGRVEKIRPAYTSQTCSGCGHRDPESRETQPQLLLQSAQ